MQKRGLVLFGVLVLIVFGVCFVVADCEDSDEGANYTLRGMCEDDDGSYIDSCLTGGIAKSYYCTDEILNSTTNVTINASVCDHDTYKCPGECELGICIEAEPVVNDTNNTNNTNSTLGNSTLNNTGVDNNSTMNTTVNDSSGGDYLVNSSEGPALLMPGIVKKPGFFRALLDFIKAMF